RPDLPDCPPGQASAGPPVAGTSSPGTPHAQQPAGVAGAPTAPDAAGVGAPDGSSASGVPQILTDSVRADILGAVDRANAALATATQTLDPSGLAGAVAGPELSDDMAE